MNCINKAYYNRICEKYQSMLIDIKKREKLSKIFYKNWIDVGMTSIL